MFLDRVTITIKAGDGGDGHTSFFRSKLTMNGGPDGGDGGKGGDVIFVANEGLNTLYGFTYKKKFIAEDGTNGEKQLKHGKDGQNVIIEVPCGTVILDDESKLVIADLTENGQKFVALKGGLGGRGNNFFKSPTRQAPNFSQTGERTQIKKVILELRTIADVGLVGFPNVGKSTLLSVISNANPKIANYPFTTLYPNLGMVSHAQNSFVVADIPGLIENASEGAGLGHYFLRHVERVRLIVHLVDVSGSEGRNPVSDFKIINDELKKYNQELSTIPQIVVLSKVDMLTQDELNLAVEEFKKQTGTNPILMCSIINEGVNELLNAIVEKLSKIPKKAPIEVQEFDFDTKDKTSLNAFKTEDGTFVVEGGFIDNLIRGIVLDDIASNAYFQNALKKFGIINKLKELGLQDGDTVKIKDIEFVYSE